MVDAGMVGKILEIVVADVILAGDNAVVIALAVHRLPARERRLGILFGTGAAVALRVAFTILITLIMGVPLLMAVGAALLLWIAVKLLCDQGGHEGGKQATGLWNAVGIIALADITMSLDNMIAVGGIAKGNISLLIFGLLLSIPLVVFASGILSKLMNRFPLIVWGGAGLLGWVAGEMTMADTWIVHRYDVPHAAKYVAGGIGVLVVLALGAVAAWRRKNDHAPAIHTAPAEPPAAP